MKAPLGGGQKAARLMENFTPIASTIGGILIGLSASLLLLMNGRIAGISGIASGILNPKPGEIAWRMAFLGGLVGGGVVMAAAFPALFVNSLGNSLAGTAAAGLVVGFGVRLGSGCTSGHGVCGLSRMSARSLAATLTFIATGAVTVFVIRNFLGGHL
jgi:uncharacterized membrane protein YedE/YeeE